ncbi:MAG TPA: hypothetical protein VFN30_07800 [Chitinophagaceae bacterium]|nr:hypothetical protein [Chitinophagaceae bacterium]
MKKIIWLNLIILLIISGCTSSKITSTWKAQDVDTRNYKKIMVLGLIRENDRTIQQYMEDHLVNDLKEIGYTAISSLLEYGPKAFDNMTEDAAINKLKNSGVDAVLTIVLLDKEKERKYIPGYLFYSPYGYYYNRFWGYRATLYQRIYEPGYYVTDTKYFWESNVYDMSSQKLVYSVQTQSFDPASSESMGHDYGKIIVKTMEKENILQRKAF